MEEFELESQSIICLFDFSVLCGHRQMMPPRARTSASACLVCRREQGLAQTEPKKCLILFSNGFYPKIGVRLGANEANASLSFPA